MEELLKWAIGEILKEKDNICKLKEDAVQRRHEFLDLQYNIRNATEKNKALESQVDELTKKNQDLLKTTKVLQGYGEDCDMISDEIKRVYPALESMSMSLSSRVFHIFDILNKDINNLKESNANLKQDLNKIEAENNQLNSKLGILKLDLEQMTKENDSSRATINVQLEQIYQLNNEIDNLKREKETRKEKR